MIPHNAFYLFLFNILYGIWIDLLLNTKLPVAFIIGTFFTVINLYQASKCCLPFYCIGVRINNFLIVTLISLFMFLIISMYSTPTVLLIYLSITSVIVYSLNFFNIFLKHYDFLDE